MSREFHSLIRSFFAIPAGDVFQSVTWRPPIDVYRCRDGWLVKADLAGVRPEDIELYIRDRLLTIRGVRRDWSILEDQQAYSMEIAYNRFERTIELPGTIHQGQLRTEYRDGMLLVSVRCGDEG